MGWTFTSDYRGGGIRAYLDKNYECENDAGKWEIRKSALVNKRTYYAAMCWTNKDKNETRTLAVVTLVKHVPADPEGYTLGWKDMSEEMGVCQIDCPLSILDLLDPPHNDNARKWRRDVHAYHTRRKSRPKSGDIVRFVTPLTFTDGSTEDRFRAERYGRRGVRYRGLSTGALYRISRIEDRNFTIENSARSKTQAAAPSQEPVL